MSNINVPHDTDDRSKRVLTLTCSAWRKTLGGHIVPNVLRFSHYFVENKTSFDQIGDELRNFTDAKITHWVYEQASL